MPLWAHHRDALPRGPHPFDDEFDDPGSAGQWIQPSPHPVYGTIAPAHDIDTTVPSCLYLPGGHFVYRKAPAYPFTVSARLAGVDLPYPNPADASLAICSGDPVSTPYKQANLDIDTPGFMTPGLAHWQSYGVWLNTSDAINCPGVALLGPVTLRWVVDSPTSATASWFFDDGVLPQWSTTINPGFSAVPYVALVSDAIETVWDWVRFSQP